MEIKKGDKVKFLNESGGGIIVRIIDNRQALVQIEDGFEIPMLISNLVKTEAVGERNMATEKKSAPGKPSAGLVPEAKPIREAQPLKVKEMPRPLFAFVPVEQKGNSEPRFELYLLNDGDFFLYYTVAFEKTEWLRLHEKGELEPEMKVSLGTFAHHELLKINAIVLDFLVYKEEDYKYIQPIHFKIPLKSYNLLRDNNLKENDYFYDKALIIDCTPLETFINENEKKIIIKDHLEKKTEIKKVEKNNDLEEVDLHIEEIVDDLTGLNPGEILNIQMARFTTSLEGAMKSNTRRIVFIHGVGNGKLKFELRKTLESKYPELKYQDASFAEYGFGATMVILK